MSLPPLLSPAEIKTRLLEIFPEGTTHRNYVVRDIAAHTVFVALYVGAIGNANDPEYSGQLFGPKYVYRMTDEQALQADEQARRAYAGNVAKSGYRGEGTQWYADTSREPIRDETLREGLIPLGAVSEREGVPTTSSSPRYALSEPFAALLDPDLAGEKLQTAILEWQAGNLSKGAMARTALLRAGAGRGEDVLIAFPNGETRKMKSGPSSLITKGVIEKFALRFLADPAVLLISESGRKLVSHDQARMDLIGLHIAIDKELPDIILADLGPPTPRIVFVEVVATDGPVNSRRKQALGAIVAQAGLPASCAVYVTAYSDRDSPAFKKTVPNLAWGTHAWFMSEPENLISLRTENEAGLAVLD